MFAIPRSAALVVALVSIAGSAFAADRLPFESGKFQALLKERRPVLVDITASWCPTCKAQHPIIEKLAAGPEFNDLTIFMVDFDTQKDAVRAFRALSQSTLIAFKGGKETARSVGDTRAASIEALVRSTLQ
jgi:thioredoxin 1